MAIHEVVASSSLTKIGLNHITLATQKDLELAALASMQLDGRNGLMTRALRSIQALMAAVTVDPVFP